ncbi:MAG: uroporphyrinogen-III synthase [Erythrobacter sp.]
MNTRERLPIIAIRPEPGLSQTIAAGKEAGLTIAGLPLSVIEPVPWQLPDTASLDALLIGSANAIRLGGKQLEEVQHLPVYAVGQTTAKLAREAGFEIAAVGEGGLQDLTDRSDLANLHVLRLAGEERISLHPPIGMRISERIVYKVAHQPLSEKGQVLLKDGGLVLLHSASAAANFAQECERVGLDCRLISLAALGPRILAAAGSGWGQTHAANRPTTRELLALAADMWQ